MSAFLLAPVMATVPVDERQDRNFQILGDLIRERAAQFSTPPAAPNEGVCYGTDGWTEGEVGRWGGRQVGVSQ